MVAQTALAILNLIMHVARIFMAYMSGKLKGGKKKKRDNIASVEKDL